MTATECLEHKWLRVSEIALWSSRMTHDSRPKGHIFESDICQYILSVQSLIFLVWYEIQPGDYELVRA